MRAERSVSDALAVDFTLESTAGGTRTLRQHRGSPVVVFYEARARTGDNAPLKRALHPFTATSEPGVVVLAVGDMQSFDLVGARPVARVAVRAIAARLGFEILLDWKGVLTRPPFGLDAAKSNVLVLDRSGAIVFRHSGVLGPSEIRGFFSTLRR